MYFIPTLNKILFYAPNYCSPSIHTPADGIFPTQRRPQDYSTAGIFPTRSQSSTVGILSLRGLCLYVLPMRFPYSETTTQTYLRGISRPSYWSWNPLLCNFLPLESPLCCRDFPYEASVWCFANGIFLTQNTNTNLQAVSYTHLTLPTKRIV